MIDTTCEDCPIGFSQIDQGQASCIKCSPGEFNDHAGADKCKPCSKATYFGGKGRDSSCIDCPTGWSSEVGSAKCQACGAGTFGVGCKNCPLGYARKGNDIDATQCQQCNLGETTPDEGGAATCSGCDLGTYGSSQGHCSTCPSGKFQDEREQAECKTCIDGKIPNLGKTACESTTWTTASDCNDGQYLNDSSTYQENHTCAPCPRGASCKGDIAWWGVQAKYGWWRLHVAADPHSPPSCLDKYDPSKGPPPCAFAPCLNPHACHGAMNPGRFKNEKLLDAALEDRNETCDWDNGYKIDTCGTTKNESCRLCGK
jgi:hypothetical protein